MGKHAKTGAPEQLRRSPSHLLHLALQHAVEVFDQEAGEAGLTQRQYAVLCAVDANEGASQIELVRATGIDRSTLAQLVARMILKGLLARARSETDNRVNAVHLAPAGREALAAMAPRALTADARILRAIGRSRRDGFIDALRELAKAGRADPAADEAPPTKAEKKKKKSARKLAKINAEAAATAAQ
jgi:DNA-binding MarR family transcriptional regulator